MSKADSPPCREHKDYSNAMPLFPGIHHPVIGYSPVNYFHKVGTCFEIDTKVKNVTFLFSKFSRLQETEGKRIGAIYKFTL